jgi:hypothetical protein
MHHLQPKEDEQRQEWKTMVKQAFPMPQVWKNLKTKFARLSEEQYYGIFLGFVGWYLLCAERMAFGHVSYSLKDSLKVSDFAWAAVVVSNDNTNNTLLNNVQHL